jgi:hypothetical protein
VPNLSYQQIETLWTNNGGDPRWAPLMAAIAEAESGGNTQALNNNPSTGDYSVGLWQINYFQSLMLPRTQKYGSPAYLQATPDAQAKAAVDLFAGGAGASNWKGDAAWRAWQANGGIMYPTQGDLAAWGARTSSSGQSGGAAATTGVTPPSGIKVGGIQIVSAAEVDKIKGWFLMISGGFIASVGLVVVLASVGLESRVGRAVAGVTPVGRTAQATKTAATAAAGAPAPPPAAAAYRAGERQGGRDENARQEGLAQNRRNRARAGRHVEGAPRRATRPQRPRGTASLTPRERADVESF